MPSGLIKKYKERQAISRLKNKDKDVFILAYDEYGAEINRFIYYKVGREDEANDLTSQVFLKTWEHIQNKSLLEAKTLRALFYHIARNIVIDYYRKKNVSEDSISLDDENKKIDVVDDKSGEDLSIEKIDKESDLELIESKLSLLKEEYRDIIVMRFINELSPEEISEITGKSKGNVRVLIHRSLKALRDLVSEEIEEEKDEDKKASEIKE